jgi:hypothetical protein
MVNKSAFWLMLIVRSCHRNCQTIENRGGVYRNTRTSGWPTWKYIGIVCAPFIYAAVQGGLRCSIVTPWKCGLGIRNLTPLSRHYTVSTKRTYQETIGSPLIEGRDETGNYGDWLGTDKKTEYKGPRRPAIGTREFSDINVGNRLSVEDRRGVYHHKREDGRGVGHETPPDFSPRVVEGIEASDKLNDDHP